MNDSSKLGTGAIIGIIAGGVCLLVLCAATTCYLFRQSKQEDNRVIELRNNGQNNNQNQTTNQSYRSHTEEVIND